MKASNLDRDVHVRDVICPCLPAVHHDANTTSYYHDANVARVQRSEDGHP